MIKAQKLLEQYKLTEFSILYSWHKHCRARDKMLKLCAENLKEIVNEKAFIEILARMIKAASETVNYNQKCLLYEDALRKLNNVVRETAIKVNHPSLTEGACEVTHKGNWLISQREVDYVNGI